MTGIQVSVQVCYKRSVFLYVYEVCIHKFAKSSHSSMKLSVKVLVFSSLKHKMYSINYGVLLLAFMLKLFLFLSERRWNDFLKY